MKAKSRHKIFGFDLGAINKDFKDTLGSFQHKHRFKRVEPHIHQCQDPACSLVVHNPGPLPSSGVPRVNAGPRNFPVQSNRVPSGHAVQSATVTSSHAGTFELKPEVVYTREQVLASGSEFVEMPNQTRFAVAKAIEPMPSGVQFRILNINDQWLLRRVGWVRVLSGVRPKEYKDIFLP